MNMYEDKQDKGTEKDFAVKKGLSEKIKSVQKYAGTVVVLAMCSILGNNIPGIEFTKFRDPKTGSMLTMFEEQKGTY